MKSEPLVVKKILGKTKAQMFGNLKVGDRVMFSKTIEASGSHRGRTYASYIKAENLATGEFTLKSFNEIAHFLDKFEFEPAS